MSFKTLLLLVITVLATVVIMQNTDKVSLKLLLWQVEVSKVLLLPSFLLAGFLLGFLVAKWPFSKANSTAGLTDSERDYLSEV